MRCKNCGHEIARVQVGEKIQIYHAQEGEKKNILDLTIRCRTYNCTCINPEEE